MKTHIFTWIILGLVTFFATNVNAKDIWVNDNSLLNDVNCTAVGNNSNTGLSKSAPFLTLAKAVSIAVSGDVIHVEVGTYSGASNRDISITIDNLTITGSGLNSSIFEGGSVTGYLFDVVATNFTLEKIKVQNYSNKGAVNIASKSSLDSTYININYCYFETNDVSAIHAGHGGGAIYTKKGNPAHKPVSLKLLGCIFNSNEATESMKGGAVYITNDTYMKVTESQVVCNVNNSQATSDGGIYYIEDSNADFIDCLISGGGAGRRGGAICMTSSSLKTVNIIRSTFYNNQGQKGSILYIGNEFNVNISNSLFYKNTLIGGFEEGGILVDGNNSTVIISNSTFANNSCSSSSKTTGLKVNSAKNVEVYNSIFWGNTGPDVTAASAKFSNCTVDPAGGPTYTSVTGILTSNPLFTNSATLDFTLQNTSPAIDKGLSATTFTNDITKKARTGVNDMGAYEFGSTLKVMPTSCNIQCDSAHFTGTTEVCKSTTTITAVGSGSPVFQWWTKASGGTMFHLGDTYTTSVLNADTTFYIRSSNDGCSSLVPVKVTQKCAACTTTISYSPSSICKGATNPTATKNDLSLGTYSSTAGLVFVSNTTGEIDLAASTPGTYSVTFTVTANPSCQPTASVTITAKPTNPSLAAVTQPTCTASGTVQVTNHDPAATYGFSPSAGISINGTGLITATSGTYKFAATKGGCTSDSVSVTFNGVPGKPTISGAATICVGQQITLTGSGTAVSWASSAPAFATVVNAASNTTTVTGVSAGSTTITYTDNSNCTQTASITVDPAAVGGTATATNAAICANASTTINLANSTGTIQWQSSADGSNNWTNIGSATLTSYTTPALATGTYYYRALLTSGVCSATATSNTVTITVSPSPISGTSKATPDTICSGNTSVLTLTGSTGSIQWQESTTGANGTWSNISGATGGTSTPCTTASLNTSMFYKALVTSGTCVATESAPVKVTVLANVAASVTIKSDKVETNGTITICPDKVVNFTASATPTPINGSIVVNYNWKKNGGSVKNSTDSTFSSAGLNTGDKITCDITVTGSKCITGSPAVSNQIEIIELVNDLSLATADPLSCNATNGKITVSGTGSGNVTWVLTNDPATILGTHSNVTLPNEITGLGKGDYTVFFDNGTCKFSSNGSLTDPNAPQYPLLSVSSTLPICQGQSVTITANVADILALTGSTNYHWTKDGLDYSGALQPQASNSITVNASGNYAVKLVDGVCSSNSNDTLVVVTAIPAVPTILNDNPTFCSTDNKKVSDLTTLLQNATKTIIWYDALSNVYLNSEDLKDNTSYYAEQSEGACKSPSRLQVNVKVTTLKATYVSSMIKPTCSVATGGAVLELPAAGVWTVTATPTVGNDTIVVTPNNTIPAFVYNFTGLKANMKYTFVATDANGCISPKSGDSLLVAGPQKPSTPILEPTTTYCESKTYKFSDIVFSPSQQMKYFSADSTIEYAPNTTVQKGTTYKFVAISNDSYKCGSNKALTTAITMDGGPTIGDVTVPGNICAVSNPTVDDVITKIKSLSPLPIPADYKILFSWNKAGTMPIPTSTSIGSNNGAPQTYYYNIENNKGCQNPTYAAVTFTVDEGPKDLILKSNEQPFCASKNPTVADLDATKLSPATGILKWYITPTSTSAIPSDTKLQKGYYYASLTSTMPGSCESILRKEVFVDVVEFSQTTLDGNNDYTFCVNSGKLVSDLVTNPYIVTNIQWSTGGKVLVPTDVLIQGTYSAVEVLKGCVSDKPQQIEVVFTEPNISPVAKKLPLCGVGNGKIGVIGENPTYTYVWKKDGVVQSSTSATLEGLSDNKDTKYEVTVTDIKGCVVTKPYQFTDCEPTLPPQIITPNGDKKNDTFVLHYAGKYPTCKLYIYNRWGAVVYVSDIPYKDDWDGKSNAADALGGGVLPAATYFYMIDKGDGTDPESGFVELVK